MSGCGLLAVLIWSVCTRSCNITVNMLQCIHCNHRRIVGKRRVCIAWPVSTLLGCAVCHGSIWVKATQHTVQIARQGHIVYTGLCVLCVCCAVSLVCVQHIITVQKVIV